MLRPAVLLFALTTLALAEPYRAIQDRRPEQFHPETGYRIDRQRAPTPDDIPGPAQPISAAEAKALLAKGALAIDVFGAAQSRYDELDGTWLVSKERLSLPGATWLPETGRGVLDATMQRYLADTLARLTQGDPTRPLIVYCIADCWMSWNAAQRIAALGYTEVHWFRHGTDGWRDIGEPLVPVDPIPVGVE
ncbi:MAG: rhodanese-like domain-containing protein [Rhodobacter sp.]|nr:rhodanese-like domain-containing protein [Rhodobacter sp.]